MVSGELTIEHGPVKYRQGASERQRTTASTGSRGRIWGYDARTIALSVASWIGAPPRSRYRGLSECRHAQSAGGSIW